MIKNYSRHPFNKDQKTVLTLAGYEFDEKPLEPFWNTAEDLTNSINNQRASVVCPSGLLMEAMSLGLLDEATLITWTADQKARSENLFAINGFKLIKIKKISHNSEGSIVVFKEPAGTYEISTLSYVFKPTVKSCLKTGEEFPY